MESELKMHHLEDISCSTTNSRMSHHSEKAKRDFVSRLNRIEAQVREIKWLIEKDTYCDDVITQISATQAALNGVANFFSNTFKRICC